MRLDGAGVLMLVACMISLAACSKSEPQSSVEIGRQVYLVNCTQCHNPDPAKPGPLSPDIAGSSRELIADRVLHLTYPPGYKPKRATHTMTAMPQLASKIDDLTAYLDEAAKNRPR